MAEVNFLVKKGLTVPKGSAATPSVIFDASDPNTGIYSPGADQLALSTNGTGRVFVDANGRISVGGTIVTDANLLNIQGSTATDNVGVVFNKTNGTPQVWGIQNGGSLTVFNYTASSGALTIDTSNRVGIGTSLPGTALDVTGSTRSTASAYNPFSGTNWNTSASFISAGAYGGGHSFVDGSAGFTVYADSVGTRLNVAYGATGATPTTGLAFTNAGRVGIGTTGPSYQLELSTDSAGKPSTNTWTIVSDRRIKDDIELADLDLCYQAVKDIPLKRFKWKDEVYTEEQVPDRHKLGWIAQDVELVFPKAVTKKEFTYGPKENETTIPECRDLNADQLYAAMYGAIQKLIDKVEDLEAQLASLKS